MTCSFTVAVGSLCGPTTQTGSIIPLSQCMNDLTEYLKKLGITEKRGLGNASITEQDIILNRSGFYRRSEVETQALTICRATNNNQQSLNRIFSLSTGRHC